MTSVVEAVIPVSEVSSSSSSWGLLSEPFSCINGVLFFIRKHMIHNMYVLITTRKSIYEHEVEAKKVYTEKDKKLTEVQEKMNRLNSQFETIKETFMKSFIAADGGEWDNKDYLLSEYDRLGEEIKKTKKEKAKIKLQIFLLTPNTTTEVIFDPETEKCINLADSSGYILDNPKKRSYAQEKLLQIVAQKQTNMETNKTSPTNHDLSELNQLGIKKEKQKEEDEEEDQ